LRSSTGISPRRAYSRRRDSETIRGGAASGSPSHAGSLAPGRTTATRLPRQQVFGWRVVPNALVSAAARQGESGEPYAPRHRAPPVHRSLWFRVLCRSPRRRRTPGDSRVSAGSASSPGLSTISLVARGQGVKNRAPRRRQGCHCHVTPWRRLAGIAGGPLPHKRPQRGYRDRHSRSGGVSAPEHPRSL